MIKAEVNVTGTVKRNTGIRTDRNNNPYLSLIMTVCLPDAKQTNHSIDVFVSLPNAHQEDVATYTEGMRISVSGSLDIRKRGEELQFYLTGNLISTENVADLDAIGGTMTFRGHLKKENVYEEKSDKNGHPFIVFSAYSAEKVGESFVSTWVNFMRFPEKDADISTINPDWMRSKAHMDISGDLQVSSFGGVVRLSCRVKDMQEHVYVQH